MGRLTWSTGLDMLSPCRGCSPPPPPPPPPPGPSASSRRKSMLAASGDRLGGRLWVPASLPRGKRGPGHQPRVGALRPGPLGSVRPSSKRKNPLRDPGSSPRCPHSAVALCPLLFCPSVPVPLLWLANSLQVATAWVRSPLSSVFSAKPPRKLGDGGFHQVEPRSPPPRAAECQRGLSAAGVFGFSPVTFSFDRSRWEWGRGGRGEEEEGEGRGAQSAATESDTNTAAEAGLRGWGQGALMAPPDPVALLSPGSCLQGLAPRLWRRKGEEGGGLRS